MVRTLLYGLLIFALWLLPDVVTGLVIATPEAPYSGYKHLDSLMIIAVIIAIILMTSSLKLRLGIVSVLLLMQSTQLVHFAYFKTFYSQYSIGYMFSEMGDFIEGIGSFFGMIWPSLLLCLACAIGVITLCVRHRLKAQHRLYNAPGLLLIALLCLPLVKSLDHNNDFKPSAKQISVRNGLYSWNYYFALGLKAQELNDYTPYKLVNKEPKVDNLILIIGESANPTRMSLFGAPRDTTPYLSSLSYSKDFHYQLAMSAAVATQYSLGYFINGVYEPDNVAQMGSKGANLFRIAQDQGFELHFLSNHTEGSLSHSYRYGRFQTWIDKTMVGNTWGKYDEGMVDTYLQQRKQPSKKQRSKQFVVLHMQNMHVDYVSNFPSNYQEFIPDNDTAAAKVQADYDNALRYFDDTFQSWLHKLKGQFDGRTLVVYVPDHGEHLGESGRFGHGHLDIETATIPIMAFNLQQADQALSAFKQNLGCLTSHYKIHQSLASLLGVQVINPNADTETFYVGGLSLYGAAGWIKAKFEDHESLCKLARTPLPNESATLL